MQIDAPNRDFPRRCEKQGGMAQSVVPCGRNIKPCRMVNELSGKRVVTFSFPILAAWAV